MTRPGLSSEAKSFTRCGSYLTTTTDSVAPTGVLDKNPWRLSLSFVSISAVWRRSRTAWPRSLQSGSFM